MARFDYDLHERLNAEVEAGRQLVDPREYILAHGRTFEPAPLTDEEYKAVLEGVRIVRRRRRGWKFPRGECFNNSSKLALAMPDVLKYTEGFFRSLIPIHHAWITINGKVVDMTQRWGLIAPGALDRGPQMANVPKAFAKMGIADRIYGIWFDDAAFFGREFSYREVAHHYFDHENYSAALLHDPRRLKGEIP